MGLQDKSQEQHQLTSLLEGAADHVVLRNCVQQHQIQIINAELLALEAKSSEFQLSLPDGFFFPLPYSTVREDQQESFRIDTWGQYVRSANHFRQLLYQGEAPSLQQLLALLEKKLQIEPLKFNDTPLLPLGVRILGSASNGIDIHCENAFLNQLQSDFRRWFYESVDIENALSLFITLTKADSDGDLVLFNHEWHNAQIALNNTSYEQRHDFDGSLFTSRGFDRPTYRIIQPNTGEVIIFRAAQIWHAISAVRGRNNRVTIGFFIAKGKDGKAYYWA